MLILDGVLTAEAGTNVDVTGEAVSLLSTTTVAFNADADTVVYTVPAGKRMVPYRVTVVAAGDAGATTTLACGQNTAEDDFISATELSNLDAANDVVHLYPAAGMVPTKSKSYAAATVIEVQVAANSGVAGNSVLLFGTLYNA